MGYAIPIIAKLKTGKALSDSYNHNMRIFHVANADPLKKDQNVELADQLNGRSYADMAEDTIRSLQAAGTMGVPRKDAIRGFEVMLTYSYEDTSRIDPMEWARVSLDWLRRTFNPPGMQYTSKDPETGAEVSHPVDNVKHAILHMDEQVPHIHAFVVPVDANGRLNGHAYIGERGKLVGMHDSYAAAMEPFGLKRAQRHRVATHEKSSEFYNRLLEPLEAELPPVREGETALEYRERANDTYRTALVHHTMEMRDIKNQAAQEHDEAVEVRLSTEKEKATLARAAGVEAEELTPDLLSALRQSAEEQRMFSDGLAAYPDRTAADDALLHYQAIVEWQRQREAAERARKEKRQPGR